MGFNSLLTCLQWSNSIHLVKDESGFVATVRIPWGAKVEYKFLVDGKWQTSPDAPTETDPSGRFVNNVYTAPPKPPSTLSSAVSYVASGLGGVFQNMTGADTMDAEKVRLFPFDMTQPRGLTVNGAIRYLNPLRKRQR